MENEVVVGKIVGKLGGGMWAQVYDYVPNEEEKTIRRGRLVASVGLVTEAGGMQAVEMGREVIARLHELYYGELEEEARERLSQAVGVIGSEFPEAELVVVGIILDKVYVVTGKEGGVWVKRGVQEGWLIQFAKKSLVGKVVDGETLVMGNRRFWEGLPMGTLRAAIGEGGKDVEQIEETVGAMVHGSVKGEGGVGAIIKFKIQTPISAVGRVGVTATEEVNEIVTEKKREKFKIKLPAFKLKFPQLRAPNLVIHREGSEKRGKKLMWLGVGFLVLLAVVVGVGKMRATQAEKQKSVVGQKLADLEFKFGDAKALTQLNQVRSRELAAEVKQGLEELKDSAEAKDDPRYKEMSSGIDEVILEASGVRKPVPNLILDLGLVRSGMRANKMAMMDGNLAVLDSDQSRVTLVTVSQKNGEVIAGKDGIGQAQLIAGYPGKLEVLSDKGVVEIVNSSAKSVVGKDEGLMNPVAMKVFSGNIYVLDSGANTVWVYRTAEKGFGTRQTWIRADQKIDLSGALTMSVDGSIWVGSKNGVISKITQGVSDNFNLVGLDKPFGDQITVYTDDEEEKLYVLDKVNKRVVVIKKTGEYEGQYMVDQVGQAVDMVVMEKLGKMYLLTGDKIWEVGL